MRNTPHREFQAGIGWFGLAVDVFLRAELNACFERSRNVSFNPERNIRLRVPGAAENVRFGTRNVTLR